MIVGGIVDVMGIEYTRDIGIQWSPSIVVSLREWHFGCYTEVGIQWSPSIAATLGEWHFGYYRYTVEPLYSGHPWGMAFWLLYGGGCCILKVQVKRM